jgi:hypothetical protein
VAWQSLQSPVQIDDIESLLDNFEESHPKLKHLAQAVEEFRTSIVNNGHLIPNDGERYRNGEAIATGFVESTVNQMEVEELPDAA